ncbi:hypothetical protein [Mangrovihabitans endophyticus]|uniref:Uncharacterized protein n=1 Tax=Mangrovihabitans endophyticus TaxID=1751298 RepID=A0A8J3BWC7_9ACTN|nr:hypothetical protein [Mangrovihabitans endophyticus]GGK76409.1 hypothetical protein GCM10012284_07930 [Mangrovihabitans endophyticus]
MAVITGTVECVQIADDSGFTRIRDTTTGTAETLILWFAPVTVTEFTRVMQSMWVSLLREAMGNGLRVTAFHPDDSAFVGSLALEPA